jgi:hypothetical protein
MLEQTRRQASIFIYLIFGLLIVIFILGINPGNKGGTEGCGVSSNVVVAVDGNDASQTSYHVAYAANGANGRQKVYVALDEIIRRELLAQAAADRGIRTSGTLVDEEIKRGYFFLGGQRIDYKRQFFEDNNGEPYFKYARLQSWASMLNVSVSSYREEQERGLQAALMNDLVTHSVRVSRDEALADYLYDNNTVTYDVVAFDPAKYRRAMRLSDADLTRFVEGHTAEVQARYKTDERLYKGVKPQLALREIFIPKALPEAAKPADDKAAGTPKPDDKAAKADDKAAKADDKKAKPDDKAAKADDKAAKADDKAAKADDKKAKPDDKKAKADDKKAKPDDKAAKADDKKAKPDDKKADKAAGDAPRPFGLPIEVAKAKLEAVRAQVAAGKLTFPDAEKQLAADSSADAPAENGDRGWKSVDNAELGEKALNDAVKALKPGEMTPVITTERGTYLVIATARREGDLSFDQVKNEIAKELARDVWSKEAAKRDALEALARAQGAKGLEQQFEREPVKPPGGGLQELLSDPNIPQEEKQRLIEQLMQQQKHGSLDVHEQDVPVAWSADDGSAQGSAPAPAAGGTPPATGSAAPATGSAAPATGSAAPATGSAAPATGAAAAPAPAAPVEITASKDVLPQIPDVARPKVNRLGPAPRQAKMPGVGTSKEAATALFDELSPGNAAKKIYEGEGGSYVLIQLIERAQPKVEDFDKTADAEIARMQDARGKAALHEWLKSRCETLTKAGRIRPAPDRIRETDDKGNPAPTVYHPCMYFDYLDR